MRNKIFKLTNKPISSELINIIERLEQNINVPMEEIMATKEVKLAESMIDHSKDTFDLPERDELRLKAVQNLLEYGSVSVDYKGVVLKDKDGNTLYLGEVNRNKTLDIVIGLPASGKSSALVNKISAENHAMVIDNDEAKKQFPEFNDGWGGNAVHRESQFVSKFVFDIALKDGKNIVLPKIGSDTDKLVKDYINPALNKGYIINIHYVDIPRNKALGRLLERFCYEGRYLQPSLINKYNNEIEGDKIKQAYEMLKNSELISGYSYWNNDVDYGMQPILLESSNLRADYIDKALKGDQAYGRTQEYLSIRGSNGINRESIRTNDVRTSATTKNIGFTFERRRDQIKISDSRSMLSKSVRGKRKKSINNSLFPKNNDSDIEKNDLEL